jgi:hypothetical protein
MKKYHLRIHINLKQLKLVKGSPLMQMTTVTVFAISENPPRFGLTGHIRIFLKLWLL